MGKCNTTRDLFAYAEDNRPSIIYIATNVVNGKRYVGITRRTLRHRMSGHKAAAKAGCTAGKFYNAIRKYGFEAFSFEVFKECSSFKEAQSEEIRIISELKPEYNTALGGQGALGYRHSPEIIERIASKRRGKPNPLKGIRRTIETIEKMRAQRKANPVRYWLGKSRSRTTIEKIIAAKRGCKAPSPTEKMQSVRIENMRRASVQRCRKVMCLDDGAVFESAACASHHYGWHPTTVAGVCNSNGKRKSVYGKRFKYLDEMSV